MSDVLIRIEGTAGRITLDRPRALNALTLEMIRSISAVLIAWAVDPAVHLVVVDGAGERGLCAGGDIRSLYEAAVSGDLTTAATFFREEYQLNDFIARYPKPYVALMDGIVMGGGIGVSAHGSHRVVTERSVLAMPETGIGFVPDVGGTYLLAKQPDELGTHLGLTGGRIGAADAILCRVADVFIASAQLDVLMEDLQRCDSRDGVDRCLKTYAAHPPAGVLEGQREWIRQCYASDTVEDIVAALSAHPDPEARIAAGELSKHSPTSLKVTLCALRRARNHNDLRAVLQQEYCISLACLRGHDFMEGVRAAIVDKDRNPIWQPARLEDVDTALVEGHFSEAGFEKLKFSLPSIG